MNNEVNQIIKELIEQSPTLEKQKRELLKIVKKLLADKPDVVIDDKFLAKTRKQLFLRAKQLSKKNSQLNFINMFKLKLVTSVAVVVLVIAAGVLFLNTQSDLSPNRVAFENDQKLVSVSENAFGDLSGLMQSSSAFSGTREGSSRPQSGGGSDQAIGMGGGGGLGILPYYLPTSYKFVYTGESLDLTESQIEIVRRIKGQIGAEGVNGLLRSFDLGLANFSSFSGASLQNFTLTEDKDYGYLISVDLQNGTVSINQNWLRWPELRPLCNGSGCPADSEWLTVGDIPSDGKIIGIAERFLSEHGISTKNYGEPVVDEQWLIAYEAVVDKSQAWIPDTFSVIYPFQIDGKIVHDMSGRPTGMMVSVNTRYNRVIGVWNLTTQSFESSSYAAVTDPRKILDIVERGGIYNYYPEIAQSVVEIEIGTPSVELVQYYLPNGREEARELFVPALIFPILNPPQDAYYFQPNIVVPLAKEIIDSVDNQIRPL